MFNLTKKICKPLSVSGREQAVCGVIAEEIAPYVDSVSTDALGNLIAFKAGNAENKKKIHASSKIFWLRSVWKSPKVEKCFWAGINRRISADDSV